MTSVLSRRAARSAVLKLLVWVLTSRWWIIDLLFWWMNSIGSSIVIMLYWWFELISSIRAARVVDLPCPVGPVTRTIPCL